MNKTVIAITKFPGVAVVALGISACEAEKSRNPLSPNVAGPIAGVSLSVPQPASPVNGVEVLNNQPLRLTFNNSSSNGERPFWYVVELASDAQFSNKMYANGRVSPGTGPQTSVVVDGTLTAERSYFWRVKADDGANESQFSTAARFDLVVPVVIGAPVAVSPINGETTTSNRPVLTVNNGEVQGRAGRVEYWFEVALDPAFARTLVQQPAERSAGPSTSAQMPELPSGTLFYWRAIGLGVNATVRGPASQTQSFRTPAPAPPPPSPGPPAPGPPTPAPGCSAPGSPANWSTDQWRECFFSLVAAKGAGPTVTPTALSILRADLVARGADWQNGWRGDYRPRIFLPVPNCPPATRADAPDCSYSRAVDMGDWNQPWQWHVR
jgi:hypothetical protein